jgi:diguanylate cyclase
MAASTNPSEIAREVLRQLAVRRIPPTPDNYFTLYYEIAEQIPGDGLFPEKQCKDLLGALDRGRPAHSRLVRVLEDAIRDKNWERFQGAWSNFMAEGGNEPPPWGELIAELMRQWETHHAGLTPGKKRDALDHVLGSTGKDPDLLYSRLRNLLTAWGQNSNGDDMELATQPPELAQATAAEKAEAAALPDSELTGELRELFAFALETAIATQLVENPKLAEEARSLAKSVRSAVSTKTLKKVLDALKQFAFRLELMADDQRELRTGLLHLLQLLIDNVNELVEDDQWLHGQIAVVRDIVARPLSLRAIDDAEQHIKEVIFKQSQLKHSLNEAKEALKDMLAGFVDHLADFADSTSDYHDKVETCAQRIATAKNITELRTVIDEVMRETRIIQLNAQRSRDELRVTQQRVRESEQRISELQVELDKASSLVRHDQLTGALNRHGLEEVFQKEAARTQRRRTPLSIAILDIDNFKKLNDSLGHDAGDAALVHLITVIKNTMRPTDLVARFGGEEFVIILPDTALDEATHALQRLQRELTKHYFMHDNQKLLITFSAGVTEYQAGEEQAQAIKRADSAMYEAKHTGKNRVVSA